MPTQTTWQHFNEITSIIDRLNLGITRIKRDLDQLKLLKESILDDAEFKAKLKMIIDIWPGATMESLVEDYIRFQSLRDWLEENEF